MGRRLIGIRRALLHKRGQGTSVRSCEERLGAEAHRSQGYLGQHARTGAMMGITADGIVCGRLGRRLPEAERWDQTGWQDLKGVPWNLQACRNLKSILRPSQAHPRQSEENEANQNLSGPETKLNKKEYERKEPNSTRHLQRLHQGQMQMRTTASKPRELEGRTLKGDNSM